MREKAARGDKSKKLPKQTLKEKREAKREKTETAFLKPRKGH